MFSFEEFQLSLQSDEMPPVQLPATLRALWHDAKGDWDTAHSVAQDIPGVEGAWVHAYLHRKEGDLGNAAYWYSRARKPEFDGELSQEWEHIVKTLLLS